MTSNSEEASLRKPLRFQLSRLFRVRDTKHSRVITPPPGVSVTGPLWFLWICLCCFPGRRALHQLQNANTIKTIRVGDFDPAELERLNSTIQLDWKLYAAVLSDDDAYRQVDLGRT